MTPPENRPEDPPKSPVDPLPQAASDNGARRVDAARPPDSTVGAAAAGPPLPPRPEEPPPPARRTPIYRDFNLLQAAILVFLLDQLTKFLVRAYLPFGYSFPYDGFFRITHTHNTGSAFGIFQGYNTPLIFVSLAGIIVLALIYQSQARPTNLLRLSLALQTGGALGNLLDRFRLGAVTDFIDIGAWPVFNLADAAIVTGLCLLGWALLRPAADKTAAPLPAAQYSETALPDRAGAPRRNRCPRRAGVCPAAAGRLNPRRSCRRPPYASRQAQRRLARR